MEYLLEQRGKTSLTRGAARNVKSSKQKKAFLKGLMNSIIFGSVEMINNKLDAHGVFTPAAVAPPMR